MVNCFKLETTFMHIAFLQPDTEHSEKTESKVLVLGTVLEQSGGTDLVPPLEKSQFYKSSVLG